MAWVAPVIAAVVSAAGTAYSASQQAKANRNQRNNAALANQPGGGTPGNYQPTALQAEAKSPIPGVDQMALQDAIGRPQEASFNELPTPKSGFSSDAKPPGAMDTDYHAFADQTAPEVKQKPVVEETKPATPATSYLNSASSLAGTIGQLAQRPQVAPLPLPQPGPMNFTPTALAMLARRGPYGGGY